MTYMSWEPRYRVTTVPPGKLDLFVVTFIDGRRATLQPITEYDDALAKAQVFGRDRQCQIKVLPLAGPEMRNLLGLNVPSAPAPSDAADRRLISDTLLQVTRESDDSDARQDAFDLLVQMGVIQS